MSKTKRALPEDIDITSDANDYSPAEQAHDEAEAMKEMALWDATNTLKDNVWMGTCVIHIGEHVHEYKVGIASVEQPTPKQVIATVAKHTSHSESTLAYGFESGSVSAYSQRLNLYQVEEQEEIEVPF